MSVNKINFKVQYIIHSETKWVNLKPEDKLSSLNALVVNNHKVNINDYELIYKNSKITSYEKLLKDIVGKDQVPIFTYNKIIKDTNKPGNKQNIVKPNTQPIAQVITISKVSVENYPTRPELIDHLNKFMSGSKEYSIHNADSIIEFSFKNSVIYELT
jgi:hypothetical protein